MIASEPKLTFTATMPGICDPLYMHTGDRYEKVNVLQRNLSALFVKLRKSSVGRISRRRDVEDRDLSTQDSNILMIVVARSYSTAIESR